MITKIIKSWLFDEQNRRYTSLITSDKIRLNAENKSYPRLQLKQQGVTGHGVPIFSTDSDITAKSRMFTPNAARKWLAFESVFATNEQDFKEFSMELSDKAGNWFTFASKSISPIAGDRIFQGDYETTILSVGQNSKVMLDNATNINNGRVYVLRSACDIGFRIYDKNGDQWVYDTGTLQWVTGGVSDWNSGFVISNHIDELDLKAIGKGIGFYINLKTDDQRYTPYLKELKVLGEYDINFADDIIYNGVIKTMDEQLRPTTVIQLYLNTGTDTINLEDNAEYDLETDGYNMTGCQAVYNLTTDPGKTENLFDSYTLGPPREGIGNKPGIVKLTSSQPADSLMHLEMIYFPEIAINTHHDSYEVNEIPSIVFERVEKVSPVVAPDAGHHYNEIKNKLDLTGVKIEPPEQYDLIFGYAVFTGNQSDQHLLGEALHRFFVNVRHIISWGLDEPYPIVVREEFRSTNTPNASNVNTHIGEFRLQNVTAFIKEPKDVYLVDWLSKGFTTN